MIRNHMKKFLILIFIIFFSTFHKITYATVDASLPTFIAKFGEWNVFTIEQNGQKVCYTISTPKSMSGNNSDDRDAYIMVSFFGNYKQEISIVSGYFYRLNSVVDVSIDGKQERFIAENETIAWPEKIGSDKRIIKQMIDGFKVLVFSESTALTYSVDTYSLSGFKKAYNKIFELCK